MLKKPVKPMLLETKEEPFDSEEYIFEYKWDGFRTIVFIDKGEIYLQSRNGKNLTTLFPELIDLSSQITENLILDGEICYFTSDGRSSFQKLLGRLNKKAKNIIKSENIILIIWDILSIDNKVLYHLPLYKRKEILDSMEKSKLFQFSPWIKTKGRYLYQMAEKNNFEGIVAKKIDSPYEFRRSKKWLKIKIWKYTETIICAYPSNKKSLIVGKYIHENLEYMGSLMMYLNVDDIKIKLTNLDKIFFPEAGLSKGDIIDYYIKVYPYMRDYLYNRPLSLVIYPDGIHGKSFYQKNCPEHVPKWLTRKTLYSKHRKDNIDWLMINKLADLIWVINSGSIELHGWFSSSTHPENPDFAVFDLDPGTETTLKGLIKISKLIIKILNELGLESFIKTSGQSDIHIYIPLEPLYNYRKVRLFLSHIADIVIEKEPDLATTEWRKEKRQGKLYIDYRQNGRSKTLPSPYSLRPVKKATISTPLFPHELDYSLKIKKYNYKFILQRLEKYKPWHKLFDTKQKLPNIFSFLLFFLIIKFFCSLNTGLKFFH